jgi:hypothetical protein
MKKRVLFLTIILCVALAVVVDPVDAQNKRIGSAAAPELLIPVGARDMAMGGSSLASSSGVEAIHWNPAGLGRLNRDAEGMFSSMSYIADINVNYGAVAASFGDFGVIGLSLKSLDMGDIPLTTAEDPEGEGGRFFSPTYFTLGFSYARALTTSISAGASIKIVQESIDRVSATGLALDFGVQYHGLIGIQGLQLGVAVKNIGPQMKFDGPGLLRTAVATGGSRPEQQYKSEAASFELPSTVEIGLGYGGRMGDNMLWNVTSSFTNNNLYLDEYRVGGEVGMTLESLRLFGRAGIGMVPQAADNENIFGATFGFGIGYAATGLDITVDYAYREVEFFDANQVISIKLGF